MAVLGQGIEAVPCVGNPVATIAKEERSAVSAPAGFLPNPFTVCGGFVRLVVAHNVG